ncbi:MAG TPA: hypothetical protein VN939_11165 [Chthoniobacterales bacterium]|jgi:hypothetical protein|nr:hypothetical protein [Chthoniobacterales bacterium]
MDTNQNCVGDNVACKLALLYWDSVANGVLCSEAGIRFLLRVNSCAFAVVVSDLLFGRGYD